MSEPLAVEPAQGSQGTVKIEQDDVLLKNKGPSAAQEADNDN